MFWIGKKAEPPTDDPPRLPRNYRFSILTLLLLMIPMAVAFTSIRNHYLDRWTDYSSAEFERQLSYGRPIIVFVGADWDATAMTIEVLVFQNREVSQRLRDDGYAKLYADLSSPSTNSSDALTKLGCYSSPVVAIFHPSNPDTPIIFDGAVSPDEFLLKLNEAAAARAPISKP